MRKDIVNILKSVDALKQKKSEQLSSSVYVPRQKMQPMCLLIHTNVIHVIKYFTKRHKLKKHIDNNHTYCLLYEKVYPTQESLEFHFEAVHKTGMAKHSMGRDPTYKNHKLKKVHIQFK